MTDRSPAAPPAAPRAAPPIAPPPAAAPDFVVGCISNNDAVLRHNLERSPMLASGAVRLVVQRNPETAARGINRLIEVIDAPVIVLAHDDVYLPRGWDALLARRIAEVAARDPDWALIGSYGLGEDRWHYGPVWSSSIGAVLGRVAPGPVAAHSFDEHLIVLRRASGLRCDEALPHFHFYGTDLPAMARTRGLGAWIVPLPLVHNDRFKPGLGTDFAAGYRVMQRKWRAALPLNTPVVRVSWHGLDLWRERRSLARGFAHRRAMAMPTEADPAGYADRCGWRDLAPGG
jgi:hypothetical protein